MNSEEKENLRGAFKNSEYNEKPLQQAPLEINSSGKGTGH